MHDMFLSQKENRFVLLTENMSQLALFINQKRFIDNTFHSDVTGYFEEINFDLYPPQNYMATESEPNSDRAHLQQEDYHSSPGA